MHKILTSIFLLGMASAASAEQISIHILNIKKAGTIHIGVISDPDFFSRDRGTTTGPQETIVAGVIEEVTPGDKSFTLDVPKGVYAINVFNDTNGNEKLDYNIFGIPKEQYGFSRNPIAMGIPKWDRVKIRVHENTTNNIYIRLKGLVL